MQTTSFEETSAGTIAVTYTDPYDLPMIGEMVAENCSQASVWKVIVAVGGPDNYTYGPVMVTFYFGSMTWLMAEGATGWHLEHGEFGIIEVGDLENCSQESIYSVIRKVAVK